MMPLYYFSTSTNHNVTQHLADYLGIPLKSRTGDPKSAVSYPGLLYIIDGPNQSQKFDIIQSRSQRKLETRLIYDHSHEAGPGDYADYLARARGITEVHWLINRCVVEQFRDFTHCAIDYFAISAVDRMIKGSIQPSSVPLMHRPPRVNCLVSKLESRPTRLYALWQLWRQGLSDSAVLGCLATDLGLDPWQHSTEDFNEPMFWQWLKQNLGACDAVEFQLDPGGYVTSGYPFDPGIYANSMVSIVCETTAREWGMPSSFITEKTYRPMINRSPCVWIAGDSTVEYLKSLGYHVFDNFLTDPLYSRWGADHYGHVKAAVSAAHELLGLSALQIQQLQASVDHNYKHLLSMAQRDRDRARSLLGLDPDPSWLSDLDQ